MRLDPILQHSLKYAEWRALGQSIEPSFCHELTEADWQLSKACHVHRCEEAAVLCSLARLRLEKRALRRRLREHQANREAYWSAQESEAAE